MKPIFESAVVGTSGKSKLYQSSRVIDIFNLTHDVANDVFANTIIKFGKVVTDKEIAIAQSAYDNAISNEDKKKELAYERYLKLDLIQQYKESLIGIRDCIVNTNNGKSFLLPENNSLKGRYHSQSDVLSSIKNNAFSEMIKSHCLPYDQFVLEPVNKLNVSNLIEPEDLNLEE